MLYEVSKMRTPFLVAFGLIMSSLSASAAADFCTDQPGCFYDSLGNCFCFARAPKAMSQSERATDIMRNLNGFVIRSHNVTPLDRGLEKQRLSKLTIAYRK